MTQLVQIQHNIHRKICSLVAIKGICKSNTGRSPCSCFSCYNMQNIVNNYHITVTQQSAFHF